MENVEQLEEWYEKHDDQKLEFKDLVDLPSSKTKFNESQQVSAIVFLASKLKDKSERFFLHGEHDVLYIGSDFSVFEDFTESDVKTAIAHGIHIDDESGQGGFQIYASM